MTSDGAPGLIPGRRGSLPALAAPALSGAQEAERDGQGPEDDKAAVAPFLNAVYHAPTLEIARSLATQFATAYERALPIGRAELPRRSRGLPGASALPRGASPRDPHHQRDRACLRGAAPAHQGDPPLLRREELPQAGLRRADAGRTALAESKDEPDRAWSLQLYETAEERPTQRARPQEEIA